MPTKKPPWSASLSAGGFRVAIRDRRRSVTIAGSAAWPAPRFDRASHPRRGSAAAPRGCSSPASPSARCRGCRGRRGGCARREPPASAARPRCRIGRRSRRGFRGDDRDRESARASRVAAGVRPCSDCGGCSTATMPLTSAGRSCAVTQAKTRRRRASRRSTGRCRRAAARRACATGSA